MIPIAFKEMEYFFEFRAHHSRQNPEHQTFGLQSPFLMVVETEFEFSHQFSKLWLVEWTEEEVVVILLE